MAEADWPQWRGPTGTGAAGPSPRLLTAIDAKGPKVIWESEPLPSGDAGGYSSPTVAGGRVFAYVCWRYDVPLPTRMVMAKELGQLGAYAPDAPAQLLAKIEAARVAPERASLKGDDLRAWTEKWIAANLTEEQKKAFGALAADRINRGANAFGLDLLGKLHGVRDKAMSPADFEAWLTANGFDGKAREAVVRIVPTATPHVRDVVICLDGATGKTLWKKEYSGSPHGGRGMSCTPLVRDGRCYFSGWSGSLYCLDSQTGQELWQVAGGKPTHSSPVLVAGKIVTFSGTLMAFDAATGRKLWETKAGGGHGSPAVWTAQGKDHVIVNGKDAACVDPADGKVLWKAPGGGDSTPVASGNTLAILTSARGAAGGLLVYRIGPDKVEQVACIDMGARGCSPIVADGRVYALGEGQAVCVAANDGKVHWQTTIAKESWSSPILADGKIIATLGRSVWLLDAGNGNVLAKAPIDLANCTSPAFSGGRLYVRGSKALVCYELAAN
jgi:outer membrane protein assembly factor BamB